MMESTLAGSEAHLPEEYDLLWRRWYGRFLKWPLDPLGKRNVPTKGLTSDGKKLGLWLNTQRIVYRRGSMLADRIRLLESAGIVWQPADYAWEDGFRHFIAVQPDEHGRRHVPTSELSADGFRLGKWQENQRQV
jgi:hypothetical protein|tara:strand:+ start:833 stop:1234 length:402 start_codon:yes stop_codon:yes gene_type:complete